MRRQRPNRHPADQVRLVYAAANSLPADKQYHFILRVSTQLRMSCRGMASNDRLQHTIANLLQEVMAA